MGKAQREKGKRFERQVARDLRSIFGEHVRRGWQSREGYDAADVQGTPFWVECKVGKGPRIRAALEQAELAMDKAPPEEATGRIPLAVCHFDNDRRGPLVAMRWAHLLDLVKEWKERGEI